MKARLIAIEGIDGAGTTTQARLLTDWMNEKGLLACQTCEPSQGPVGQLIRGILQRKIRNMDPAAIALLFAADRVDHVQNEILPKLQQGIHVISDRYVFSSLAYQSLQLDRQWVAEINQFAPSPDLTIYIRIDHELACERRRKRGTPEEIFESNSLQKLISQKYDEIFQVRDAMDPERIHPDPEGSRVSDPSGSDGIPRDPDASGNHRRSHSSVEILDGSLPIEALQLLLRQLVQKVATSKKS